MNVNFFYLVSLLLVAFKDVIPIVDARAAEMLALHSEFKDWMNEHNKNYNSEQLRYRFKVWRQNRDFVLTFNRDKSKDVTYELSVNHLADFTREEYKKYYLGFKKPSNQTSYSSSSEKRKVNKLNAAVETTTPPVFNPEGPSYDGTIDDPKDGIIPDEFDWRSISGALTTPKAQMWCGACYAFSSTAALETCQWRKTGSLVSLSEQNLIDCTWDFGNEGCLGGLMTNVFSWMQHSGGINSAANYPYSASEGRCQFKPHKIQAQVKSWVNLRAGDEQLLKKAVMENPVCIGLDSDPPSFQFYSGGVYHGKF